MWLSYWPKSSSNFVKKQYKDYVNEDFCSDIRDIFLE